MMKALHTSVLGVALLVGCGGSAARGPHDPEATAGAAGAGDGSPESDGGAESEGGVPAVVAGSAGRAAGGGGGTTVAGAEPENLGGADGMAGAGPDETLVLPRGCEPRARTETENDCTLAVYCDTVSQLTECHRLNSGRWQCHCGSYNKDRIYQLENVAGLPACALTAYLCSEEQLELGEEACELTTDNGNEVSCSVERACGRPIELDAAPAARAWLMRFGSASCQPTESGRAFQCGCADGAQASEYDLLVDSSGPDCKPLVEFCMSGETPDFGGKKECLLTNAVSSTEGCERTEICAAPMPLSSDVSLAKVEPRYANCTPRAGGGASCYCSGRDSVFSFQLPDADAEADASCDSSILNCDGDAVITGKGEPSCQPTSMTSYGDSCEADLSCTQDATVDDREIVAEGRLIVACARTAPGRPWWCSCASDQETTRFGLGSAESTAWQACDLAPAACLEHLAVHLGPYGEYVQPPYPIEQ